MKWIDIPPVWLVGFLAVAWQLAPVNPGFGGFAAVQLLGGLAAGAGVLLMVLAAVAMRRAGTTVVPHRDPQALVTTGVFRLSRNPIYLGDALILTGLVLRWEAPLALPLIPAFVWVIERRFILPEESRLRRAFGQVFDVWAEKTRRWI